jgi:hypothetical protein
LTRKESSLSRITTLTTAVAASVLIGAAPASASTSGAAPRPIAHASGDPVVIIPSIVKTRTTRVDNAIERLTDYVDDGDTVGVDRTGKVIRRQLAAAWRGAVYYVKNPPPPVADDAQAADDAPTVADPVTTAMSVMDSYHSVTATIGQLVDGARVPVLNTLSTTLFWTLNARDRAITAANALEGPPPEDGGGEDAAATFATSMPLAIPSLDDEIQQIKGLQADATDLRPGGTKILTAALAQTQATETRINTLWPPVIDD